MDEVAQDNKDEKLKDTIPKANDALANLRMKGISTYVKSNFRFGYIDGCTFVHYSAFHKRNEEI